MRTRTRLVIGAAAVAVVVGAVVVVDVRGPSGASAPLPAHSASARTVAAAFLDAAVQHDCGSLRTLSIPDDTRWCPASLWERWQGDDPRMTSWRRLRSGSDTSDAERCFMFEMRESGVTGMEPGTATWGLCLHRAAGTWRVAEEGVG